MPLDKSKSLTASREGANCDWVRINFHGLKKPGFYRSDNKGFSQVVGATAAGTEAMKNPQIVWDFF
jgi:hypothetical protein